ncbi:hypothetical protein [Methanobacterium spitsbergense]|uniref:Uncharacterized protein n=1 Tax=Methanobacterium spitsbergense TaxID=2874285 RepID=A0A8T5UKZ4_9EURY|nr:hypothetical protein [Methanobacterium spitsbergense]MBZ2164502.1 hypothetical protein [Methanobacterium spitsbergense]
MGKEIRKKILEILYEKDRENFRQYIDREELQEKLHIDFNELDSDVINLKDKGLLEIITASHVYFLAARITTYGKDLVENENELINQSPVSFTQNIVSNSSGVFINSHDISINIQDSFNEIYSQIENKNPQNTDEVKEMVTRLQSELTKENINKTNIQKISNWLRKNANWTIPTITQIIIAILIGGG